MENIADNKFASELWFMAKESDLEELRSRMERGGLVSTVRLGDRSSSTGDPKGGYEEGRMTCVRIQNDEKQFERQEASAVVRSVLKKKIGALSAKDLKHGLPGERGKKSLRSALENFYGKTLTDDDIVTIIEISFLGENTQPWKTS